MTADVAFVSMPFGNVLSPSFGLSLLKGALTRDGMSCRVHYFGFPFLRITGLPFYQSIANDINPTIRELAGEWIFAHALFDERATSPDRYLEEVLGRRNGWITADGVRRLPAALVQRLLETRLHVDRFLDQCVEAVLTDSPRLVGFTSVFQQHVASLALARRLRQAAPDLTIIMGGANCEGVMGAETMRSFPYLDAVVSGEADLVINDIARRVLDHQPLDGIPGVKTSAVAVEELRTGRVTQAPPVHDMDGLPHPDFSDFFEQFSATRYRNQWIPRIFFESSRGCWWGEKQHCTFCGLNGMTMKFRSKSAGRALAELEALGAQHPGCDIQVVDNILDMKYFDDFLPELARRRLGLELFYETKSNLRKTHVQALRDAGVIDIQPGIESFSDAVLQLMRKGVTGLQNVQLLKWCRELGVTAHWNVLWGFPGEPPEDYARMAALVPWLTHLTPPSAYGGVRLDRFSPNYFDSSKLGFADVEPLPAYRHVYPLPSEALANLAYHFTFRYRDERNIRGYIGPLLRALKRWETGHDSSALCFEDTGSHLVMCDTRAAAKAPFTVLDAIDRRLYLACDAVTDARTLGERVAPGTPAGEIDARLAQLADHGFVARQGSRVLALAVPIGGGSLTPGAARLLMTAARRAGTPQSHGVEIPLTTCGTVRVSTCAARRRATATGGRTPARLPRHISAGMFVVPPSGDTLVVRNSSGRGAVRNGSS